MTVLWQKSVFVAGAGPVGLTAAIELKRHGFPVCIVDPDLAPSPQSRALVINQRTLDLLQPSGVLEAILDAGHRVRYVVIRKHEYVLARIDLSLIPHRFNFLMVLAQSKTEAILERHLSEQGVKVEREKSVTGFAAGREIDVKLSDGTTPNADYLLGADGAHSTVRKTLGVGFDGETQEQAFGLADVEMSNWPFPWDTAVLTIMDHHLAPFIPMGAGFGRFITTVSDCLNNLPDDAKINKSLWDTDFRISFRQASSYQQDNVFLAGDSAHIHSPVGGRGMNLGIEDACWFAWLLQQNRLQDYTALRHPVGAHVLKFTHSFTSFARRQGLLQTIGLALGLPVAMGIPTIRNRVFDALTALNTPAPPWL